MIYLNSDITKKIKLSYQANSTVSEIIARCKEKFKVNITGKFILFDSRGDALSDEDLEYITPGEPLFFSKGEEFSQNALLALYEKISTLGKGGFGTVKLYRHKPTKSLVAIKFINTRKLIRPEQISRAYKEIQILRELVHPNIVRLIEVFPAKQQLCFVMDYCEGGELKKYVQESKGLPDDQAASLALQICDAVRYCHNSNVIHRDLKPENIMFRDNSKQNIVIVDFGIAGIFAVGVSGEKSTAGSLYYLAPEVINGINPAACPELDIWSLGCIIFFLLTGLKPFAGNSRSEVIQNILKGKTLQLPEDKAKWKPVIDGTIQVDPQRRWNLLKLMKMIERIKNHEVPEEVKTPEVIKMNKSASLRAVKTPRPQLKLPMIKRPRNLTKPKPESPRFK